MASIHNTRVYIVHFYVRNTVIANICPFDFYSSYLLGYLFHKIFVVSHVKKEDSTVGGKKLK